mmetsp:Transcript_30533/g.95078  ORF Transcript_30533/g.95078 Transcript_30533/m.95078 type:complete len:259 (-) Transcript_30533:429-1205(-)
MRKTSRLAQLRGGRGNSGRRQGRRAESSGWRRLWLRGGRWTRSEAKSGPRRRRGSRAWHRRPPAGGLPGRPRPLGRQQARPRQVQGAAPRRLPDPGLSPAGLRRRQPGQRARLGWAGACHAAGPRPGAVAAPPRPAPQAGSVAARGRVPPARRAAAAAPPPPPRLHRPPRLPRPRLGPWLWPRHWPPAPRCPRPRPRAPPASLGSAPRCSPLALRRACHLLPCSRRQCSRARAPRATRWSSSSPPVAWTARPQRASAR